MGTITEDNNDKRDEITTVIVSDSHPHGDQKLVVYSDITGTVTEEDYRDEEGEMGTAVSEWIVTSSWWI